MTCAFFALEARERRTYSLCLFRTLFRYCAAQSSESNGDGPLGAVCGRWNIALQCMQAMNSVM